jgi:AcrR family transcriptional regulator
VRVRTDVKRQEILRAARAVLEELGYHHASMAAISARLGGSKATLYGYFPTKERLFAAVMVDAVEARGEALLETLDANEADIGGVLRTFGTAYLAFVTSADVIAVSRTAIAEAGVSELGRELYVLGPQRAWVAVAAYLAARMDDGRLRRSSPDLAAFQFKALLEAGVLEPMLFGVQSRLVPADVVATAVAMFMGFYGAPPPA